MKVGSGATLTLGKCTAVVLGSGAGIKVAGHLVTEGTADGKVTFGPSGTDYWQGLTATSPTATLDLAYTTLTHGGQANERRDGGGDGHRRPERGHPRPPSRSTT